jgi:hypothetical protein
LFGDMRSLVVPESADIVVSELLGSFGDNELSPECLDGAMRFLKRRSLWFFPSRPLPSLMVSLSKWNFHSGIVHGLLGTAVLIETL